LVGAHALRGTASIRTHNAAARALLCQQGGRNY
jgi:hypothetical protein